MLRFAAEFPTANANSLHDFLRVCRLTHVGSQHNRWSLSDIPEEVPEGVLTLEKHSQVIELGYVNYDGKELAAFNFRHRQGIETEWTAEYVARGTENGLWISVRISCDVLIPGTELPDSKKPYIIRKLLEELGGGNDGGLVVTDSPRYLRDNEESVAASLINGDFGNSLPIVYVSAENSGYPFVDVDGLSRALSGLAHVVVEPSRAFSFRLMDRVNRRNTYGGAVGIYWPGGVAATERFLPRNYVSSFHMCGDVESRVREALCFLQASDYSTWASVRELLSRARIAQLREQDSEDIEEWIEAFQNDLTAKDEQLDGYRRENERLRAEIRRLENATRGSDVGLAGAGSEQELFPGEKTEIFLQALQKSLSSTGSDSRANHVVEDIVNSLDEPSQRDQLAKDVRAALAGDDPLDGLSEIGFEISERGKHYRAVFLGDERYAFTVPKTPSDHRSMANLASQINRILFK